MFSGDIPECVFKGTFYSGVLGTYITGVDKGAILSDSPLLSLVAGPDLNRRPSGYEEYLSINISQL